MLYSNCIQNILSCKVLQKYMLFIFVSRDMIVFFYKNNTNSNKLEISSTPSIILNPLVFNEGKSVNRLPISIIYSK